MSLTNASDAFHRYEPKSKTDPHCTGGWWNDQGKYIECNSTQESSVLHSGFGDGCSRGCCASDADHRARHKHGGGDCMCFGMED